MFYVNEQQYRKWLLNHNVELTDLVLESVGYKILHELNAIGAVYDDLPPEVLPNEMLQVNFVVVFRSTQSNLVAVKNDSYLVPVTIEEFPVGATFDDIILLHGKKFIDEYVTSKDISEFIQHTAIQPWGAMKVEDKLYVPIEIIVDDKALSDRLGTLNGDFSDDNRELTSKNIPNGFTPILKVQKFVCTGFSVESPENALINKLKVVI